MPDAKISAEEAIKQLLAVSPRMAVAGISLRQCSFVVLPEASEFTMTARADVSHQDDAVKSFVHLRCMASLSAPLSGHVQIEATFELDYRIEAADSKPSDVAIESFAKINGLFNCWPYWRELTQSLTVRANLPALTLHLLTVQRAAQMTGYLPSKPRSPQAEPPPGGPPGTAGRESR